MYRWLLLVAFFLPCLLPAQPGGPAALWTPVAAPPAAGGEQRIQPQASRIYALALDSLRQRLAGAPLEGSADAPVVEVPLPDGELLRLQVWASPIMDKGLADRYPGIRTYAGRGLDDAAISFRLDLTPQGFHALIFSPQGTIFIDPLYHGQDKLYQVYAKKDFRPPPHKVFGCAFAEAAPAGSPMLPPGGKSLGDCQLRVYRLALSCSAEYAQFHGGSVPLVLGAMVTTMNRVNGVYEREFAVRMELVAANDTLIFLDPATDPFTNEDVGLMLGENQALIDSLIGTDGYDVGHVFGTVGGGLAGYGVVCSPSAKAIGVTSIGAPVGDPFDIDYVSHEFGHQFAGSHTFRGCGNQNENDPTAVEPGSGSTIMAYAGICGDNVQLNSHDYFHGFNLQEMSRFITLGQGNTCGERVVLANQPPVVALREQAYVIPVGTPFFLEASATDPDGDALSYCWEQFDSELSVQPPLPDNAGGPNFRTLPPAASPRRYFPALPALASGGPFSWEVLPTVARNFDFRVSVRDNAPGGGCVDYGRAAVRVSDAAGPFVVSSPSAAGIRWAAGGQEGVYWEVANTQLAPVSCETVDILLSVDGGLSYPLLLAAGQPNNGYCVVAVPQLSTATARVMVVCAGSIFFDISDSDFSIEAPDFVLRTQPVAVNSCGQDSLVIALSLESGSGFAGQAGLAVSGLPAGVSAVFAQDSLSAGAATTLSLSGLGAAAPGLYPLLLTGSAGGGSQSAAFSLSLSPALPAAVQPVAPVDGALNARLRPLLAWQAAAAADSYSLELADNPDFSPRLLEQAGLAGGEYVLPENLPAGATLYWRVRARNACGPGDWGPVYRFTTAAIQCTTVAAADLPLPISADDTVTVLSTLALAAPGVVTDVNLPVLRGRHDWINDLQFALISPSGRVAALLGPVCWDEDNFDVRFDDEALLPYSSLPCPPVDGGLYQPREPLSVFDGENPAGLWTLRVFDSWAADGGELVEWSLEVCQLPLPNAGCALAAGASVLQTSCLPCTAEVSVAVTGAVGEVAYLWSDGGRGPVRAGLCAGSYTVTVVDAGSCAYSLPVEVPPAGDFLRVSATATPAQDGDNGTATAVAEGGTPPLRYAWSSGDSTLVAGMLPPGLYTVTVTDANGCTATAVVEVGFVTALSEVAGLLDFQLTPNPSRGPLLLQLALDGAEEVVVEIYTAQGQRVERLSRRGPRVSAELSLAAWPDGVYFVVVRTARGRVSRGVVLKK
jgi:subtilisin-like proprotein convertase family protein